MRPAFGRTPGHARVRRPARREGPAALGGPADPGAVIDTGRDGNGAPADGESCDPAGRKGAAGTSTPEYAYEPARCASPSASGGPS